jgi:hypothetical protein
VCHECCPDDGFVDVSEHIGGEFDAGLLEELLSLVIGVGKDIIDHWRLPVNIVVELHFEEAIEIVLVDHLPEYFISDD